MTGPTDTRYIVRIEQPDGARLMESEQVRSVLNPFWGGSSYSTMRFPTLLTAVRRLGIERESLASWHCALAAGADSFDSREAYYGLATWFADCMDDRLDRDIHEALVGMAVRVYRVGAGDAMVADEDTMGRDDVRSWEDPDPSAQVIFRRDAAELVAECVVPAVRWGRDEDVRGWIDDCVAQLGAALGQAEAA